MQDYGVKVMLDRNVYLVDTVREDIGRVLEHCLRKLGINSVFIITIDNATANDYAVVYMKKRLEFRKTLNFEGDYLHLKCAGHILNLNVKDGIT